MRSVAVLGIGETKMGKHPDKSLRDLIQEAGSKAIADAGIEKKQIQSVFVGNFNSSYLTYQSHISFAATQMAAEQAYKMAGLKASDIDLAEVHDCFTITQIINIEDLGFFPKGKGGDAVAEGKIHLNGRIPINTSGGLKAKGHPIGSTGVSQIYEIVTQLRGEAGPRQVQKADIGLTHNIGGTAATCTVNIFKKELGRKGIRAVAICPGFIDTPILAPMPQKVIDGMVAKVPLGRLGKPEEIASTYEIR